MSGDKKPEKNLSSWKPSELRDESEPDKELTDTVVIDRTELHRLQSLSKRSDIKESS